MKLPKIFSKKELKTIGLFYLAILITNMFFILIPFQILYFNSIGLSATKIGILMAVWPLMSLLFEIPTGAIADLYGRKFSTLLGIFLVGILIMGIFFTTNYWMLLIIMMLLGISETFSSGAEDAWIIDLLKHKKLKISHQFFSKMIGVSRLGLFVSGFLGVFFVATFGLKSIWLISGISYLVYFFILIFVEEHKIKHKVSLEKPFKEIYNQTKKSSKYTYNHPVLFYLFLIAFFGAMGAGFAGFISITPFLVNLNFPEYAFGYLFSFMALAGIFSPLLSNLFIKKTTEKNLLIFSSFITLLLGFLILFANNLIFALSIIFVSMMAWDFKFPIRESYFHKFMPSKMRATIGSSRAMILSLAGIISLPLAGILVDQIGARLTIFISSLFMIPIIIFYLIIKE